MKTKNTVPMWKLERYILGELPADEIEAIRAQATVDDELRERIVALHASDARILADYPPSETAKRIRNLCAAETASAAPKPAATCACEWKISLSRTFFRAAIPAFVCLFLFLLLPTRSSKNAAPLALLDTSSQYEDRVKGNVGVSDSMSIEIWRKEGDVARKLSKDAIVSEGDVIQLRYAVPRSCYGALVSVDGRGIFTVHLSSRDGMSVPLTPGRVVALQNSYELDDAPHYEIFYLITSDAPFDLGNIANVMRDVDHPVGEEVLSSGGHRKNIVAFTLLKSDGGGVGVDS